MRLFKVTLITLLVCLVSIPLLSCASKSDLAPVSEYQVVTAQRGGLVIEITAVGNLALSRTENLAFDLFYQEGTVEEILVEEGDTVKEGQVLAKLDAEEWEDELTALEDKVITAERQLLADELQLMSKERALIQAEINIEKAEIALHEANLFQWPDIEVAQAKLDKAKYYVEYAHQRLADATTDDEQAHWSRLVAKAEEDLITAEDNLNIILSGTTLDEVLIKKLELQLSEMNYEEAKKAIEDAQIAIEDAQRDLEDVQEALDEAKGKSPIITAPFDGFITKVNVEGGDEIMTGTVAVQLADPEKFEADIMVGEMDILQMKLGGEAQVQVDAVQGISLPAEVTHISPTATISQGVVNYKIKVALQSLEAIAQEQQAVRQEQTQNITEGELPERLKQAIEEGRMTQEQTEEMMKQMQQGQGQQQPQGQMPTMTLEDFQLMEGLTVTVSIIVDERNDVLLVPNAAIATQGRQTFVQVLAADGTLEQRTIQTGISDYQFTEVTEGLSEGEQIIVPQGTSTTPTTQQGQRQQGGTFIPGVGRIR
ncbi:biotin/lipoyl-binding protein [Chloroflexota bacterium]